MAYFDSDNASGQPLLFLHGIGGDSSDWSAVIEKLPQNQHCIAFDFRGHRQSVVPTQRFTLTGLANDVRHLVGDLGLQRFMIVGSTLDSNVQLKLQR